MTITATLLQTTGTAFAAGTSLGSQAIADPASWTELTTLGTIPTGSAHLNIVSDLAAFRYAVMPPSVIAVAPPHNGILVPWVNGAARDDLEYAQGARVWVKAA